MNIVNYTDNILSLVTFISADVYHRHVSIKKYIYDRVHEVAFKA